MLTHPITPYYISKHPSEEARKQHSLIMKGRTISEEHKLKISQKFKGRYLSSEIILKQVAGRMANNNHKHSQETKDKLRVINLGKKHSEETKEKLRQKRLDYLADKLSFCV